MILPLFGGMSEIDLLQMLLGQPKMEGPQLVQETFRQTAPPGDFDAAWNKFLHDGFAAHLIPKDQPPKFNGNTAGGVAHTLWTNEATVPTKDSPEIVLIGSYSMDDGRYINNGWLQEMPDPITKLTWDNAAMMSPAFAKHIGVKDGDLVEVTITEPMPKPPLPAKGKPPAPTPPPRKPIQRQLVIAALIAPGHVDNSVTIPLGYGRKHTGPVGDEAGFNGYLLRTSSNPHFIVADGKGVESVSVKKVAGQYALSTPRNILSIEGRGLVREATLEHYREDDEFVKKIAGDDELPKQLPSLYTHPPLTAPQQWGMTVDLNVCTGCSACVIACQAENNIPIVGKLQVAHGRAMHWIRIDRYYASAEAVQPGSRSVSGRSRDGAPADDVPALRKRAVRNRLSGQRHRSQRGRPQRDGLQPLHRHAVLREQLPVQGAPLQLSSITTSGRSARRRSAASRFIRNISGR